MSALAATSGDQIWNSADPGVSPADTYDYGFTGAWRGIYHVQIYDDNNDVSGGQACASVHS